MADPFITRVRTSIREIAGEPGVHAKYTDARLLVLAEMAYAHIFGEVNRRAENKLGIRFDITLDNSKDIYQLPPIVQRVLDLEMLTSAEDIVWHVQPRSRYNPAGPGLLFEANTVRFTSDPITGYILRVHYVPSGCIKLHYGTIKGSAFVNSAADNECVITMDTTPTVGSLDLRHHAYEGSHFRVLEADSNNYVQDRYITSHDVTASEITVVPAFSDVPASGTPAVDDATYEITPPMCEQLDYIIAMHVAKQIVGFEGDRDRVRTIGELYRDLLRDLTLQFAYYDGLGGGAKRDGRLSRARTAGSLAARRSR